MSSFEAGIRNVKKNPEKTLRTFIIKDVVFCINALTVQFQI